MNEIEFVKKLAIAVNEYCATRDDCKASDNEITIVMQIIANVISKQESNHG